MTDETKPLASTGRDTEPVAEGRALTIGRVLGRYVVVRSLGRGGSASVYAAFDSQIDRQVALKVLHDGSAEADDTRRRDDERWSALMREARILGKLNHPNVVTLFDVEQADGVAFIAMELVEGVDLRSWLTEAPRTTAEILDAFTQAARGLEAAHAAGIVHGDFKPANVLIGQDGRVRVTDFGVARALAEAIPDATSAEAREDLVTLDTSSKVFVGTPYYAAPEQHDGAPATALSDQYSFFLALRDALAGEPGLTGTTAVALALEKGEGVAVSTARTPRWLVPALERGLARDPSRRHPDFGAVLRAIEPPASRRTALWVGGAAVIATAAAVMVRGAPSDPCEGAARHFDGVWSAVERDAFAAALASAEIDPNRAAVELEALDTYVQSWVETQTASCLATQAGEQSETMLDLRTHCLLGHRRAFAATLRVLGESSSEVRRAQAIGVAERLPAVSDCSDLERLQASAPDLGDPALAPTVDPVLDRLAEAEALQRVARFEDAFEVAKQAKAAAEASGLASLQARTLLHYGTLVAKLEGEEPAERIFILAYDQALAAEDDLTAIAAARNVAGILSHQRPRLAEAHRFSEHARALVKRSGQRTELPAIELNDGHAYMEGDDVDAAEAAYRRGLQALDDHPDELNERRRPQLLAAMGRVATRRGDLEAALDYQRRAMDLRAELSMGSVESSGFDHFGLATIYGKLGRHPEAIEALRLAKERFVASYGPDHRYTLTVEQSLGLALDRAGDHEAAAAVLRETCARTREHDRTELPRCLSNLALVLRELGALAEARALAEEALRIARTDSPGDDKEIAHRLLALAEILGDEGRAEEALPMFVEAQTLILRALPAPSPDLVPFELGLGQALRRAGENRESVAAMERALASAAAGTVSAAERAEVLFELASSLQALGDLASARTHAQQARALLADDPPSVELRTKIDAWLSE